MKGLLFISHQTDKVSYLQSVEIALQGGCRQIQLRMKDASLSEVEGVARKALELCRVYKADLYINDYVEVCKKINAKGVHLGKMDMPPAEARRVLGEGIVVGGTANTFDDIMYLHEQGVNYIGLGPFRFTTTKKNLSPVLGLNGYRDIVEQCRTSNIQLPIVAIGGITINDIPAIMETGVSGIALSSTILNADNPIEETKKIMNLIKQYKQ
ncbi:thiamine phosphate synthase [Dysgonomonas sp. 216]|uniref:thiamine phosphate synthase n=1 Tax=Dysgonomonas sp. 216 TaxID=2302934 RepID=UPI0013D41AF6|nr:thiamine phosphate synthase [Dysgonomonas sp. 216]NDW19188.1 thiamine phosphate synthase [Dysgonomonas sp. 216]